MDRRLLEVRVENFRSLREVVLPLGPLNVLVGPNGAGKTNLLAVFRFLADLIATDLQPALDGQGGFGEVLFRGAGGRSPGVITIGLKATWSAGGRPQNPDEYTLHIADPQGGLDRVEIFSFPGQVEPARQIIRVEGQKIRAFDMPGDTIAQELGISSLSSGLSTLPRLADYEHVAEVAGHLSSIQVFDVDVQAARKPAKLLPKSRAPLARDASNLADFLHALQAGFEDEWERLVDDARKVLPQLDGIDFEFPSGPGREVIAVLHERGLRRPTQLADASYGTIRLLGLLAMLYDPHPPALTCVEEIDHGLHPQALELLVWRLREASERTQFLIATHSPALADRLRPDELIICERRDDGSSAIPAISRTRIEEIVSQSEGLPLGELWFSGALGGDL